MYKITMHEPNEIPLGLVLLFPGRGQSGKNILNIYNKFSNLKEFTLIAIEPFIEWYPAPHGANNQKEAIDGIKKSISQLDDFIFDIEDRLKINRSKTILAGFSAGAVMAIQLAVHAYIHFNSVISHNGAILNPEELPEAIYPTNYLLVHNENDDCFSWDERYLPMKKSLLKKDYNLEVFESQTGGHFMQIKDVEKTGLWIRKQFKLSNSF